MEQEQQDFLKKDDYGKIPEYLSKIKSTIEQEKAEELEEQEKARNANKKFRLLTYEEREELTRGLQENYEKISSAYRQLPVAIHTLSQKAR